MTIDEIRENVRILQDDILYLEGRYDALADKDSPEAEAVDRIMTVKWRLLSEQREKLEHAESGSARAEAEARLAYHIEHDTLDLY